MMSAGIQLHTAQGYASGRLLENKSAKGKSSNGCHTTSHSDKLLKFFKRGPKHNRELCVVAFQFVKIFRW